MVLSRGGAPVPALDFSPTKLSGLLSYQRSNAEGFYTANKNLNAHRQYRFILNHLLLTPLRYARWLLIPGGIIAAYIVNMAIVSQSSTAAIVGTVLLPLLQAGGIMPMIAGSLLLLGSSMGGELFNPGAVELVKLAELTGQPVTTFFHNLFLFFLVF